MWDVDFQTAVAQAEIEDREIDGAYHRVRFDLGGRSGLGGDRDVAPRADPRVRGSGREPVRRAVPGSLVGSSAVTPLFGAEVPILAHELADPEKGTGVAMICTFGDLTDVTWWRELRLPTRVVIGRDGKIAPSRWGEPGWGSRDVEDAERDAERARRLATAQSPGQGCGPPPCVGTSRRRTEAGPSLREVLRARRTAARGRVEPPMVREDDRVPRAAPGTRTADPVASRVHGNPLRLVGRGPEWGLVRQPSAVLRRAVPHLVPARRRGACGSRPSVGRERGSSSG